jgi:eukaryotic-like serine/threonine-protein kinase
MNETRVSGGGGVPQSGTTGTEGDSRSDSLAGTAGAVSVSVSVSVSGSLSGEPARERSPGSSWMPPPGIRIGQYELIRELGRGGMGAVYLARDTKLGRRVAMKFLQSDQPETTVRFILEARATARCNHENIVVIHDVGEHQGHPFMVLEYLQGAPLSQQMQPGRRFPAGRAIELMVPVIRALACAHEHNIVHRDLKPDNIFVTDGGTIKVLDFGVAKLLQEQALPERFGPSTSTSAFPSTSGEGADRGAAEPSPDLTRHGVLVGTLAYMSPEQWLGAGVDHRTDIWAVGIILYKLVAGKHPLDPLRDRQLMVTGLLEQPMPSVRGDCPDLPDEFAAVIDQCLIKDKAARMPSAHQLLDALEPLLLGQPMRKLRVDESPYPGLNAFQELDADRFFGRSREIAAAVNRLRDQPLLTVVGPSGVGKSSFVRAGVVPALKQSGEAWTSLVIRPGRQPMAALAHAVTPMVTHSSTTVAGELSEQQAVLERLQQEPGYLGAALRSRARRRDQRMLLFVDQFEELYTLVADPQERLTFTACLASVADDATTPLRLVLSIRSDFIDRLAQDPSLAADLAHGMFFLAPPGRESLREAMVEPAEMAGYQFESAAMIEHMLDHLQHTQGALPLLQFAASKLWEMRDTGRRLLAQDSYHAIGGISGALASHADAVVAGQAPSAQALTRALFLRLVTPERTRAMVSVGELDELGRDPGEVRRLVDHLVHARLLVVQSGDAGGGATIEIVHESLIQSWPLLRRWLDENQDDAAFLEQLRTAARQWQARGHPAGLLWRGEAMEEAQRWRRRYRGELPALQQAYLDAVFGLEARATRRRRYLVAGAMVFLTGLVAAAFVALVLIRNAQQEAVSEAEAASRAEEQVREQLARVQAEERARRQAQEREREARQAAEQFSGDLEVANDQLAFTVAELRAALDGANEAKSRARSAREQAERNEATALAAKAEAQRVNKELQQLLESERERVRALEQQMGTIIEDLTREDRVGLGAR